MLVRPKSDMLGFIFGCDVIIYDEVIRNNEDREELGFRQAETSPVGYCSVNPFLKGIEGIGGDWPPPILFKPNKI
jgi:hypothetical protein